MHSPAPGDGQDLLDLVSKLYDAALAPEGWAGLSGDIASVLRADDAAVHIRYPGELDVIEELAMAGDPEVWPAYSAYYYRLDPVSLRAATELPPGTVFTPWDFVERREFERTEFHQDWARRHGIFEMMAAAIAPDADMRVAIGATRSFGRPPFGRTERQTLGRLVPHFERAFQIHARLAHAEAVRESAQAALDQLPTGVVLIDERGRVLYCNRAAERLAARRDGFYLDRSGVRGATAKQTEELRRALAEAARTGSQKGLAAGGPLPLERPSGLRPLVALVSPLPLERALHLWGARAAAVLFVSDPEQAPKSPVEWLQCLFGLTPAESRLASLLAQGESLERAADRLGVRVGTARNQLKSVFAKTGTGRQAQLVRLLLASLPQVDTDD